MQEIIHLVNEMSPYLLLGFLLAGIMHAFVPHTLYSRYLSSRGFRSVLYAALLGIPLPLCSCGVIPTAMSLRREGASKGAAVSFLIATPQTGVDSIMATYSLLGLPFAVIRPLVALLTSLFGGWLVDCFDASPAAVTAPSASACADEVPAKGFAARCRSALNYAFVEMMQDIGKWLMVGLVVAGLITVAVPDSFFALFAGNSLLSILFVLLFSIPMYLCATGSIPIAVALMLKGLTPGAALVLLMAGPASNAASILVINKVLGRRSMLLYLLAIVGGAVGFALAIDHLLPASWFAVSTLAAAPDCCAVTAPDYLGLTCTVLLLLLLVHAFVRQWTGKGECHCHEHDCHDQEAGDCRCGCHHDHAHEAEEEARRYRVEGMNCNHCRANVEKALRSVPGVTEAEVSLSAGEARVEGTYDEALLLRSVCELGFNISPL